jgi:hypothetical protein
MHNIYKYTQQTNTHTHTWRKGGDVNGEGRSEEKDEENEGKYKRLGRIDVSRVRV